VIAIGFGVVAVLGGAATVLGVTGAQSFAWGALSYDMTMMFFIPLYGVEAEMIEY